MKKLLAIILAMAFALSLTACGSGGSGSDKGEVSVFYYTYSDTYISSVRSAMDKLLKEAGLSFQNYDANGNQTTQTEQVTTALAKGSKLLIVNVVDTGSNDAAQNIIDQAKAKNVPVVFFNRSVAESVVSSYDKCVFVGTDYEMAGHMQGEMIGKYLVENYDKLDLNGDGKISYVPWSAARRYSTVLRTPTRSSRKQENPSLNSMTLQIRTSISLIKTVSGHPRRQPIIWEPFLLSTVR